MREVSFEKTTERSYGFLLWVLLFLVGAGLGFIKIDNTFWYKSATLAYALSSIIYLSTVLLRDRTIQRLAEKLAEIYSNEVKDKAYLMGLFSLSWEILGQKPAELARAVALDGEIVEAYENRLSLLGFILSLVELLEESGSDETIKKVAKVLEAPPEKIKEVLEVARKESEKFID